MYSESLVVCIYVYAFYNVSLQETPLGGGSGGSSIYMQKTLGVSVVLTLIAIALF